MPFAPEQKNVKILALNSALAVTYFVTAKFGLRMDAVYGFASLIWAPTGIALAAMLLFGKSLWPGILFTAALVNFNAGATFPEACAIAIGNTLEAVVATLLLERVAGFKPSLGRFRDVMGLVCYGALFSTMISATIGASALVIGGKVPSSGFQATWLSWWMGDMAGDLIIAPFLLICRKYFRKSTWKTVFESLALTVLLTVTMLATFQGGIIPQFFGPGKIYFIFPFVLWASIRFRQPGAVAILLLVSGIAVWSTVMGMGPFAVEMTLNERLFNLQTFLAVLSITTLSLAAIVTENRKAQQNLKKAEKAAREASDLKSEFLANMSHEVRTPLNGILGLSDLLIHSPMNKEQAKLARLIKKSGKHLLSIVNNILDFSKIEAGKVDLELTSFSIRTLIKSQIELFSPKARKKALSLVSSVSDEIPPFLKGDRGKLTQVLLNLIGNAIKFTEEGTIKVKVKLEASPIAGKPNMIRFSVKDTGIGISDSVSETLFQPFVQADGSTSRRFGGTGLGLAICKSLVERMGGKMGVLSVEGQGSEFWFVVGLETAESAEIVPTREKEWPRRVVSHGNQILVAEDDLASSLVIEKQLENLGYQPHRVGSGKAVLLALQERTYDLILLDCQMPEMDGFATARAIRKKGIQSKGRAIPIVALTAFAVRGDQTKCLEAGMDDYVSKPASLQELEAVLNKWLNPPNID